MKALEDSVRSVTMDGLVWGASKLVPIGYGIRKLQITLVVGSSVARLRHAPVVFDLMNNLKRMNSCRLMISKRRLPNLKIMSKALT
jgi:translation elongation factor EF-1beta